MFLLCVLHSQHTKDLLGHVLDHDDNIPDTKLSQGFESTSVRWQVSDSYYRICARRLNRLCALERVRVSVPYRWHQALCGLWLCEDSPCELLLILHNSFDFGQGGCDGSCGGREVGEWNATGIAGCGSVKTLEPSLG